MSRRTVSVYVNTEIHENLEKHLEGLAKTGDSLSTFFVEAANYYIENNKPLDLDHAKLAEIVRGIVQDELKKYSIDETEEVKVITDEELSDKLKGIY